MTFSGALTTNSASSPVTSATRTCQQNGNISFNTISSAGGTPEYSKNGAGFVAMTDPTTVPMLAGDTIAVRATLVTPGNQANINMASGNGKSIEAIVLTKT